MSHRVTNSDRITLHRPPELAEQLAELFPPDDFPAIKNEQDMWIRLAERAVRQDRAEDTLAEVIRENGGRLPIKIDEG